MNEYVTVFYLPHQIYRKITQRNQKILWLMDNYSAHGKTDTLPNMKHVESELLPRKATSKLQSLGAGIASAVNIQYLRCQME